MDFVFVFFLGSIGGSFANVCIYRMPKEQSVVWKGSYCFKCKKNIAWYDNIPLFSYFHLFGKCRKCKKSIPLQYFLVEFIAAISFLIFYSLFGISTLTLYFMIFGIISIIIIFIDLKHFIIPDSLNFILIFVGIAKVFDPTLQFSFLPNIQQSLLGGLTGYGIIYLLIYFYYKIKKIEAMGLGDAKLLAALGCWFGWQSIFFILFFASVIALLLILPSLLRQTRTLKSKIPFGPYLLLGSITYLGLYNYIF